MHAFAIRLSRLASMVGFCLVLSLQVDAATMAEVAEKTKSLKPQERTNYLLKGAQAEGEMVYYGTLPIDEFLPLARVFNQRYRAIALHHYFAPRDGILSRTLTEARAGAVKKNVQAVQIVQTPTSVPPPRRGGGCKEGA